jgi:hypothetical protein
MVSNDFQGSERVWPFMASDQLLEAENLAAPTTLHGAMLINNNLTVMS